MNDQDYEIVLSPELEISPADFASAWNEIAEARSLGEARLARASDAQYDLLLATTILIGVGTGVASNIIYGLITKVLEKKGVRKHTHIEHVKKPDGTESFVLDTDEE